MKDRLCWEDQGALHVLCDRETGFTMGRLELRVGWWTFTHLGRVMGSRMDKEEAEQLGSAIIRAFLATNEALRSNVAEKASTLLDEAVAKVRSRKRPPTSRG